MRFVSERCQEDEEGVPAAVHLPDSAAELEPVDARHHPVADNDIHLRGVLIELPGPQAILGHQALVTGLLDGLLEDHARDGVIFGDEDFQPWLSYISASSAGLKRPSSPSRRCTNTIACESSPECSISCGSAQMVDIFKALMLPQLPLRVSAIFSTGEASLPLAASGNASSVAIALPASDRGARDAEIAW